MQPARSSSSEVFHRPTMDDIASRAEVSKGTIYLYFKSKEEILAHLLLEGLDLLLQKMETAVGALPPVPSGRRAALPGQCLSRLLRVLPPLLPPDHGLRPRPVRGVDPRRLHQTVLKKSLQGLELVAVQVRRGAETGVFFT